MTTPLKPISNQKITEFSKQQLSAKHPRIPQPHTVEVPVAWLENLIKLSKEVEPYTSTDIRTKKTFTKYDGLDQLQGYIESAETLIGDK